VGREKGWPPPAADGFDLPIWTTERAEALGSDLPGSLGDLPVGLGIQIVPESVLPGRSLTGRGGAGIAGIDVAWASPWEPGGGHGPAVG
jgi:hypothetical protein